MIIKKTTSFLCSLILLLLVTTQVKATEECFEGVSRTIFKFNMFFDDVVLEPIAKGYNKLPKPVKKEQVILRQIFLHFSQFLTHYYKVI